MLQELDNAWYGHVFGKISPTTSNYVRTFGQLTKQDVEWIWTYEHDKAMDSIKKAITQVPVLKYLNDNKKSNSSV